ncbi:unnamed protein product [Rotaria socialis]|uniref:Uncharacterized protein n=1 Tax=Rotaria socialis TaxID=392032 RepID=A0A821IAT7_9BILA|nr:unnamed protein product [Rotaria socialis]CAF4696821.1 unnamed protein product [Rotaria socialis]
MSSGQKSLISYFKGKEKADESDNDSKKQKKINDKSHNIFNINSNNILNDNSSNIVHNNSNNILNDNSSNIVNDNTTSIHALSYTEPLCDTPSNINENSSLSTTITTTSDNKKRTYQKWYSKEYTWLVYEPNKGGFCCMCRD